MIPTKGTITASLNRMCWINQTKIQVPVIAKTNENNARPHRVELGINSSASKMPNCAEEIVAPVVGETNLFIHNCCMISPATLMPTPVQRIASNRGSLEIKKISSCSVSPRRRLDGVTSKTPTKSDHTDRMTSTIARTIVRPYFFITVPPLLFELARANSQKNKAQ